MVDNKTDELQKCNPLKMFLNIVMLLNFSGREMDSYIWVEYDLIQ